MRQALTLFELLRVKLQYTQWRWPEFVLVFVVQMQRLLQKYDLLHVLYRHLTSLEFTRHITEQTKLTGMGLASMPMSAGFLGWHTGSELTGDDDDERNGGDEQDYDELYTRDGDGDERRRIDTAAHIMSV